MRLASAILAATHRMDAPVTAPDVIDALRAAAAAGDAKAAAFLPLFFQWYRSQVGG